MSADQKSLSLDDEVKETLKLKSNDGKTFEVPKKICLISQVISTLAENDKDADEISLNSVNGQTLEKVIDYMKSASENYVTTMERPLKSNEMVDFVSRWEADYIAVEKDELIALTLAANYLDIRSLLDLCCAKLATMIKGKTAEQIRTQFDIVNDFSPEEEAAIIAENQWALDSY